MTSAWLGPEDITYVIQEFDTRGFVDLNGNVVGLVSESNLAGGFSQAFDINNNLLVAGVEVINPNEAIEQIVADCLDDDVRSDIPIELCLDDIIKTLSGSNDEGFKGSSP